MQVSKNSPVLTASRGARLIDLVKQNKLNISPQLSLKTQRRFSSNEPTFKDAPKPRLAIPNEENDYLKFSNQLKFDPNASPSSSILSKRKGDADTPDQSPFGSSSKVSLDAVYYPHDLINLSFCSESASDSETRYRLPRSILSHQKKSARSRAA